MPVTRGIRDEDEGEHERELPQRAERGDDGAFVELAGEEAKAEVVDDEEDLGRDNEEVGVERREATVTKGEGVCQTCSRKATGSEIRSNFRRQSWVLSEKHTAT